MGIFSSIGSLFGLGAGASGDVATPVDTPAIATDINPANGLPMVDDTIDVAGNPYGTDFSNAGGFDNSFGGGGFDDF